MSDTPPSEMTTDQSGPSPADTLIAAKLKSLYAELEREPVPGLFLDLLDKLDRAESDDRGSR